MEDNTIIPKIAILTKSSNAIGGVETFNKILEEKFDVRVFSKETAIGEKGGLIRNNPIYIGWKIGQEFKKSTEKFDAVLCNGEYGWNINHPNITTVMHGNWRGYAKNAMQKKTVKQILLYLYTYYVLGYFQKKSAKGKVVAVSDNVKKQLRELYGLNSTSIPNGVDVHKFSKKDKEHYRKKLKIPKGKTCLFVGSPYYSKGWDIIKELAKKLPRVTFVCVLNKGGYEQIPENMITRYNVSPEDISEYYKAVDLFILPSRFEGCSYSILEAMSCSLPIVISNTGYASSLNEFENYIVKDENVESYLQAIKSAESDKKLPEQVRNFIVSNNSLKIQSNKLINKLFEKKKKRIVFSWPTAPPVNAAATTRLISFYNHLKNNYEVSIFTADPRAKSSKEYEVIHTNSLYKFMKLCKIIKPAIIISSTPPISPSYYASIYSKIHRIPLLLDIRDPHLRQALALGFIKKNSLAHYKVKFGELVSYKSAKTISYVSEYLLKTLQIPNHAIILPNGVEVKKFFRNKNNTIRKELKIPKNKPLIIYHGIISAEKEIDQFFTKVAPLLVLRYNVHFLFIISSDENKWYNQMKTIITKKGMLNNYHEIRNVPYEKISNYLSCADLAINPLSEKMDYCVPVKLFENIACDVPVISKGKPNGGMHEFYKQYGGGTFTESWEEMSDAFIEALSDLRKYKKKSLKKKDSILQHYSRENIAKDLEKEITRLL